MIPVRSRALRTAGCTGHTEEPHRNRLDETRDGKGSGERQSTPASTNAIFTARPQARRPEKPLQRQPLADKTVEGRDGGNGERAHQEEYRRERHPFRQAARAIQVPVPVESSMLPAAMKSRDLYSEWFVQVVERRHHQHGGQRGKPRGAENKRAPDPVATIPMFSIEL